MKVLHYATIICFTLFYCPTSYALSSDANQPIDISSDEVDVNFKTGKRTFIGNVRLIQGSLKLRADRLDATYKDGALIKAVAKGRPAAFKQRADGKNEDDEGKGNTITLFQAKNTLELKQNALLKQQGNTAKGNYIYYNRSSGKLKVKGGVNASSGNSNKSAALKNDPFFNAKAPASKQTADVATETTKVSSPNSTTAKPEEVVLPTKTELSSDISSSSNGRSRLIILPKSKK